MENEFPIRLLILFPLIGFLITIFYGRRLGPRIVSILSPSAVLLSFIFSCAGLFKLLHLPPEERVIIDNLYTWINVGMLNISVSFRFDQLSILMALVVTGVGFLIHVYSVGYMHGDKKYTRFFAYLNLFIFSMLILVLGNNLLLMFLGWEGVGLCSYLLIGFWFEKVENAIAAIKAFIVNRIGDMGFIMGIILLFWSLGSHGVWTLDFDIIKQNVHLLGRERITIICLLLFMGATGKSAQLPLYVWLPDAMAGPTPVSALIHAATMVTAGVYMVTRMSFLYSLSPFAMETVAVVGGLTAFFAATIALVQNDIKKVLAYSTISQLGYMFLGVGVGAYSAGMFHLITHAFFKALLFLGAGSVIHGLSGEQDLRKMGGLRKSMPITWITMLLATLAISGIPPFAGFFSKDEILWGTLKSGHYYLAVLGIFTAGLTAFYMFRMLLLAFWGRTGAHAPHAHESPPVMTIPLAVLAFFSVVGGLLALTMHHFIEPVASYKAVSAVSEHSEWIMVVVSIVAAATGISVAFFFYVARPGVSAGLANRTSGIYRVLLNKYYVDEIYNFLFVRMLLILNSILAKFDIKIIDGIVNASSALTVDVSYGSGKFDLSVVDGSVNGISDGVISAGSKARRLQTGNLQNYVTAVVVGIICLVLVIIFV
ncbi:MAG TPA: NADH-quinone oxidoreductase subunit L [bacterium]